MTQVKEPRLPFSDYPAKEQERDAMRSRFRQVYLMKVDGKWAHFTIIDGKDDYDSYEGDLTQTYYEVKRKLPQHVVKVIQNKGLEDYLRDMLPKKKQAQTNIKQLTIWEVKNDKRGY
jgi:hypothetical protein